MKNHYPINKKYFCKEVKNFFYFRLQKYNILFIYTISAVDFCY